MSQLLVAYDIPCDKRRTRIAKELSRLGRRIQYSVFLCSRPTATEVAEALEPLMDTSEDDIRIHPLCATCSNKTVLLGRAQKPVKSESWSVV